MARAGMELDAGGSERFQVCRLSGSRTGARVLPRHIGLAATRPQPRSSGADPTAWANAAAAPGEGQLVDRSV
jgi:hypothetical protein